MIKRRAPWNSGDPCEGVLARSDTQLGAYSSVSSLVNPLDLRGAEFPTEDLDLVDQPIERTVEIALLSDREQ